ncbi:Fic family protein [Enterococcus avium]|uniref:ImmA/IrrE family metallo-endopeptidase n=1 Tax=Enterococcus avium TaxID=33945 RepID=UPI0028907409|nr:ImmA/IrrE family metallo-endopeptidase [Enterococcus avium]MDT2470562.1 Fic family protein [Enterococcus avium]
MKTCLLNCNFNIYETSDTPESLAKKAHFRYFGREVNMSDLPIDPFKVLKESGAVYSIVDFDKLEGFYLLPENDEPAFVGINKNRPVTRQRFTGAHELCHHLKDNQSILCKTGDTVGIEVFANKFASEFLVPTSILRDILKLNPICRIDLDEVLKLSVKFGVSFQSMLIKVSSVLNWRDIDIGKVSKKYKPNKKKTELGLSSDSILYQQILNSYQFIKIKPPQKIKTDFLRYVITNDHRIENGSLSDTRISEILTLIRLNGVKAVRSELTSNESEVIGQYLMYNQIFDEVPMRDSYLSFLSLHRKFYECAPFPEAGGCFREANARISGTSVKTSDPEKIGLSVYQVGQESNKCLKEVNEDDISSSIKEFCSLHHKLTVIHPFQDGNGRTTRAFLNLQLLSISVPPIYILEGEKSLYRNGLVELDRCTDLESNLLFDFILQKIINNYSIFLPTNEE